MRISGEISGRLCLFAVAVAIAACGGADAEVANEVALTETTTAPDATTTTTATTTPPTTTTTSSVPETTSTSAEPDVGIRVGGVVLGEVELDILDPIVTLTAEDPWNVAVFEDGAIVMNDPDLVSEFTRAVILLEAKPFGATIDEWADTHDTATIESRNETQVGGLDAIVYDISYTGEDKLAILTSTCCGGSQIVRNTEYYRLWTIETGRDRPLVIFVPVLTDDLDWLDKAEKLVATIEIAA